MKFVIKFMDISGFSSLIISRILISMKTSTSNNLFKKFSIKLLNIIISSLVNFCIYFFLINIFKLFHHNDISFFPIFSHNNIIFS